MIVDVINAFDGLEWLNPEWSELYHRCSRATPFQSAQWLIPWTRHFFKGREIWALAMRNQTELIGFAPLFCWGVEQRTVSFLGTGISDYGDLLFAPGMEDECVAAVWAFLADRQDGWDELDLQELRCGSGLLRGQHAEECSVCPVLDLSSYPESMDHKHRIDVRRAQSRLNKHHAREFLTSNRSNLTQNLDDFFRLYEMRWGVMDSSLRQFYSEAAANFLATGDLRLSLLRIDNMPAAAIYAFTKGQVLYCYLSGFDPAMSKLSPGAVLLGWVIEQAIAEGTKYVDFLRQPEPYKYLWGARDRVNYKLKLPSPGGTR